MIWQALTAVVSVVAFMVALSVSGAVEVARRAAALGKSATQALRDPNLDEAAREKAAQRASVQLFGTFFGLVWRSALALAAGAVPIFASSMLGLVSVEDELAFLTRIDVMVALIVPGVVAWIVVARMRRTT